MGLNRIRNMRFFIIFGWIHILTFAVQLRQKSLRSEETGPVFLCKELSSKLHRESAIARDSSNKLGSPLA